MSAERTTRNLPPVFHVEARLRVYVFDDNGDLHPVSVGTSDDQTASASPDGDNATLLRTLVREAMGNAESRWLSYVEEDIKRLEKDLGFNPQQH